MVVYPGLDGGLVACARAFLVQVLDRGQDAFPLFEERLAEVVDVDHRHLEGLRPSAASEARRCSASVLDRPATVTSFSLDAWPLTRLTFRRGTDSVLASSRSAASVARPRSGAGETRTRIRAAASIEETG